MYRKGKKIPTSLKNCRFGCQTSMQTVNGDWFCLADDYWTDWYDVSRPTNSNGNDDSELRSDLISNVSGNFASTVCS